MSTQTQTAPIDAVGQMPEIIDKLLMLLSPKEKGVIVRRFDLDNKGRSTLEEIGKDLSVTRERIRQIEKNALMKMKRNAFNSGLTALHEYIGTYVRENGGILKKKKVLELIGELSTEKLDFNPSHLDLSLNLHQDIDIKGNSINFHPYLKEKKYLDSNLKKVSSKLIKQLQKYGDTRNFTRIHKDLKSTIDSVKLPPAGLKSLIEIDKRLTIVKDGQVGLLEWRHIHPRTLRDKVLYILRSERRPLHFREITKMIEKAKFDQRSINIQAVHNELIRYDDFVLIGRGIYALSEWGYQKGTVAEVIQAFLEEKGTAPQEDIIEEVLKKRKVKRITVILSLKNNPRFERVGRKIYALKV